VYVLLIKDPKEKSYIKPRGVTANCAKKGNINIEALVDSILRIVC
jgi:hypothetical protein